MTKLTQKGVKFDWGDKEEAAFQLIKQKLCMADALSRKERNKPLRVRALVMTIGLNLPKQILEAQIEAQKPENFKKEDVGGVGYHVMILYRVDGDDFYENCDEVWFIVINNPFLKIMPPRMRTQSVGRPAAESRGGGTGKRVGRGGRGRRPRESNDERVNDLNG
ncbi:hypothetical protein Tco_1188511 [Tanacetum coccineum]